MISIDKSIHEKNTDGGLCYAEKKKKFMITLAILLLTGVGFLNMNCSKAANSYLPHWEHIPDGEPRVFEDPAIPANTAYIFMAHMTRERQNIAVMIWLRGRRRLRT